MTAVTLMVGLAVVANAGTARAGGSGAAAGRGADRHGRGPTPGAAAGPPALPVVETAPVPQASAVRPDTVVRFRFDASAPGWPAWAEAFRRGRFGVEVDNGERRWRLEATHPAVAWQPDAAQLTVDGGGLGGLGRYRTVRVTVLAGAAFEVPRATAGHGAPDGRAVPTGGQAIPAAALPPAAARLEFETGSAIAEPRHARLAADRLETPVSGTATLELSVTDDYGGPAAGARVTVHTAERGGVRPASARLGPYPEWLGTEHGGRLTLTLQDTEPEAVDVTVELEDPVHGNRHRLEATVTFTGPATQHLTFAGRTWYDTTRRFAVLSRGRVTIRVWYDGSWGWAWVHREVYNYWVTAAASPTAGEHRFALELDPGTYVLQVSGHEEGHPWYAEVEGPVEPR